MTTKRRALVLGDEAARHPFRRTLPPHVRTQAPATGWRLALTARDWRDVLATYCASFVAVSLFIS